MAPASTKQKPVLPSKSVDVKFTEISVTVEGFW